MSRQRNEIHAKQVEAWKKKSGANSDDEIVRLLINGILAVRRRSLITLSNVTVTAVIDRILCESQERFALLSHVKNDPSGLHFNKFNEQVMNFKPSEVHEALHEFLLELLESFGKITADILTKNLHQELMSITNQTSPKDLEPQAAFSLGLARKNREQK